MRNLKKFLALVLAMAMAFSLMLSAGAVDYKDYPDKDSITAEFDEAVQVLTGLKVFQGDEKGFRPSDYITRAEAAAVIYRAVTGDVTDRQTDLYKDYATFTDVNSSDWFAGYVGYCQNAGYIKGNSPTTFNPYGKVTGYEVLAMILRAVGYGKNNEFTGSSWQVNVAALSKQLGVTRDVVAAHMDQTLNMSAPREVVADLVFMTMATVPMVTYTPALAYNDKQAVLSEVFNDTLGQKVFGLWHSTSWRIVDDWGRPGYYWYKNGVWTGTSTALGGATQVTTSISGKGYMAPVNHPLYTQPLTGWTQKQWEENTVATIMIEPDLAYNDVKLECDVAHELDIETEDYFTLFVNGPILDNSGNWNPVTNRYRIVATDTVTKAGGQGRQSEFYYERASKWFGGEINWVVMIDTMLAQITAKNDAKLDPAGHVITPAQLEVTIWDGNVTGSTVITNTGYATDTASKRIIQKASTDATNWDEYSKGDFILVNAYTNKWTRFVSGSDTTKDEAAFKTDEVMGTDAATTILRSEADFLSTSNRAWVLGKADNFQGKQTVAYWNQNKHQVDGTDYNDQLCLFMDKAGRNTNTTYTWYKDQFGNIIGIGDAKSVNYGVITSIYAAISQGDSDTTGGIKAIASVTYADGTKGTVEIDKFLMSVHTDGDASSGNPLVPTVGDGVGTDTHKLVGATTVTPNTIPGVELRNNDKTVELRVQYDTMDHPAMSVNTPNPTFSTSDAESVGTLYMAPSSSSNLNAYLASGAGKTDSYGILYGHMFEFTTASDNSVVAIEVAGQWTSGVSTNTGNYVNNANGVAHTDQTVTGTVTKDTNDDARGRVYKSLGYLALNPNVQAIGSGTPDSATAVAGATVYLDNNTQIILRSGNTGLKTYTLSSLAGDIVLGSGTEADWADVDGDGRADYLYVVGTNPGTVTYNLFYYNGGAAQWNGSNGTIVGYLDGVEYTANFNSLGLFNAVNNSKNYEAHLFALEITDDVVSDVMRTDDDQSCTENADADKWTRNILRHYSGGSPKWVDASGKTIGATGGFAASIVTGIDLSASGIANVATDKKGFVVGAAGGNKYTANTQAVYYDSKVNGNPATQTIVSYQRVSNGHKLVVSGAEYVSAYPAPTSIGVPVEYWIAPTAEIVGELEWLNQRNCDVTIVYENGTAKSATQVYITHDDSDITPVGNRVSNRMVDGYDGRVTYIGTDSALRTALTNGSLNNSVIYNPYMSDGGTANGGKVDAPATASSVIYFPYYWPGNAAGETWGLTITDGVNVMYSESDTSAAVAGDTYALIDFTSAARNPAATYAGGLPLRSGVIYTVIISLNGNTVYSANFQMG